jgi:vesicle-associated membrane protein 72
MVEGAKIAVIAVARIADQALLATCFDTGASSTEKQCFESAISSLLARSSSAYPRWKDRCECDGCDGTVFVLADAQATCITAVGIRDSKFPERVALQLLRECAEKTYNLQGSELTDAAPNSLNTALRKPLRHLMKTYNDASVDKMTKTQEQVDALKGVMQDNVKKILETHVTLDQLQNNTQSMSSQANQFLRQSVDLRRQVQLRNLKLKLIVVACVLAVVLYFAMPFLDF